MFSVKNDKLMKYIPNYKLNLIASAEIRDNEFSKFHTELSLALKYVKYSKDKDKLNQIIKNYKYASNRY